MIEEELVPLPDLVIPRFRRASAPREFTDESILLLRPSDKGWLTVIKEDGSTFRVEKPYDFTLLFPSKYNWTFSRFNELDCIFKVFHKGQCFNLKMFNELEFTSHGTTYQVFWIPETSKVRLVADNYTASSKYLINIAPYVKKSILLDTFGEIRDAVDKLIKLNKVFPVNLLSPASTTKDALLDECSGEFDLIGKLHPEDIKYFFSCYKGPRMESRLLGTLENAENADLKKAYLRALATCPSPSRSNVLVYLKGRKYHIKEAHPGSGYTIKVKIPSTYSTFSPIPLRLNGVGYYQGEFVTHVSKPYVELLEEVGDIPFEILDSQQLILRDWNTSPFEELCNMIEYFEDAHGNELYPVNIKALHFTMVGHFLHYHQELDRVTGEISQVASQDFNPILANAIQGRVAKEIWLQSQVQDTEAIRADALTGHNLVTSNKYKKSDPGMMTFLTPLLKDKPGETLYRNLIYQFRDKKVISVHIERRLSFLQVYNHPGDIGKLVEVEVGIPATPGRRSLSPEKVKKLGYLLEGPIRTAIPQIDDMEELERCQEIVRIPSYIDDYLHLFPQTQT